MLCSQPIDESLSIRHTISLSRRLTDDGEINAIRTPNAPRIAEPVLIALIADDLTFIAQEAHGAGDPSQRQQVIGIGGFARLSGTQHVAKHDGRDHLEASAARIIEELAERPGIDCHARLCRQCCDLFSGLRGRSLDQPERHMRRRPESRRGQYQLDCVQDRHQ